MTPEDDLAIEDHEDEERRRKRGWLPALVLAVALAIIAWLIWTYSDFGRAPDQEDTGAASATTVTVPDVVGMPRDEALAALEAVGLVSEIEVSYDTLAPEGEVVAQDPAAGSEVGAGSTVFVGVAVGVATGAEGEEFAREDEEARVPDVIGMSRSQASSALSLNGFRIAVSELYSEAQPEGLVFEQTPKAGSSAAPGTVVGVLVSLGRSPAANATAPDVVGLSTSEAEERIIAAGLEPRVMVQPKANSIGRVYQQRPAGGTAVRTGSYLFILVGTAP